MFNKSVRLTVETHKQLSELKWRVSKNMQDLVGSIVNKYYNEYMEEVHSSPQEETSKDGSFDMINPDDYEDRSNRKEIYIFDEEE